MRRSQLIKKPNAIPASVRLQDITVGIIVEDSEKAVEKLRKIFTKASPPKFGIPLHPHDLNEIPSFDLDTSGFVEESNFRVWQYHIFIADAITVFQGWHLLYMKGQCTYVVRALHELGIPTKALIRRLQNKKIK